MDQPAHTEASPGAVPERLKVAFVDDHELTLQGFGQVLGDLPDLELLAAVRTVDELLALPVRAGLVVLDLRLADGSSPHDNVVALRASGSEVLVLTAGEDPRLIREAARAGIRGMVKKSQPVDALIAAIRRAGAGETIPSTEWAAALDAALDLVDAGLSVREREVLAAYASGQTTRAVAQQTGLSVNTIADYVGRIRAKYERVGRDASSRVDLHLRAREDGIVDAG